MAFNPLSIITGGLGAALPLVAAKMGVGKNTTNVTDFGRTSQYDPNKFQYGGREGVADQAAQRFSGLAAGAQNREAAQAANVGVNYSGANNYANAGLEARGQTGLAAGMMMRRAAGQTPSIAQMQGDRQMQQATAAQASASASARGAGAMALAQQNAAGNTANAHSAISGQTQINAANERLQAEQAAYGAYAGMRAGDAQSQGLAAQQSQYAAQLQAQQNQYNAQLQAQQRAQNDQYSMGLYGQENNVRNMQLTGGMNNQQLLGQTMMQGQGQRIGVGQANADREMQYYKQFSGSLEGMMGGATQQGMGGGAPGGGGAPAGGSNAMMANSATTGTGPMATPNTNMAIAPPVPSDDRMKFGMSPLSFLGMGSEPSGPGGTVDMGGKGYMSQSDVQQASTGLAGGGGGMPGMVGGGGVTGGNMGDLGMPGGGGGMSGGLLSDDRAKMKAFDAGMSVAYNNVFHDRPEANGLMDQYVSSGSGQAAAPSGFAGARASGAGRSFNAGRDSDYAATQGEEDAGLMGPLGFLTGMGQVPSGMSSAAALINRGRGGLERSQHVSGHGTVREPPASDPVTEQFASGLAPIRFEYRPGMGPGGQQTGVRAQQAETQPVTASMITRRPDGLRQIDPAMGLGTALAGVGHLAQKQREQDARLNELLGLSARREGY